MFYPIGEYGTWVRCPLQTDTDRQSTIASHVNFGRQIILIWLPVEPLPCCLGRTHSLLLCSPAVTFVANYEIAWTKKFIMYRWVFDITGSVSNLAPK